MILVPLLLRFLREQLVQRTKPLARRRHVQRLRRLYVPRIPRTVAHFTPHTQAALLQVGSRHKRIKHRLAHRTAAGAAAGAFAQRFQLHDQGGRPGVCAEVERLLLLMPHRIERPSNHRPVHKDRDGLQPEPARDSIAARGIRLEPIQSVRRNTHEIRPGLSDR